MLSGNLATLSFLLVGGGGVAFGAFYLINTYGLGKLSLLFQEYINYSGAGDVIFSVEPEAKPMDTNMPTYTILSKSTKYESDYKDKFGGKYGNILVDKENNDSWWEWSLKNKSSVILWSNEFKDVDDKETLKNKCEEAYKKPESEITKPYQFNVWWFCSPVQAIPHDLNGVVTKQKYLENFGKKDSAYASYLVFDRPANKNVWEVLYEKVFKEEKSNLSTDSVFSSVDKGYSSKDGDSNALNKVCDSVYMKKGEEVTNKTEVYKYCSFSTFVENSEETQESLS